MPGTGKSFLILITDNIMWILLLSNGRDETSPPPAYATNLINGTKFNQMFKIPAGGNSNKAPRAINTTNMTSIKYICDKWKNLFILIMDEYSTAGQPFLVLV